MYLDGEGVLQDYLEAMKWFKLACTARDKNGKVFFGNFCASQLGGMYLLGTGVKEDLIRAHMWLNISGLDNPHLEKGQKEYFGEGRLERLTKRMTQKQIAEAQKLARECMAKNFNSC